MKPLKTAPQILEHYIGYIGIGDYTDNILKAMRHYARVKSDKKQKLNFVGTFCGKNVFVDGNPHEAKLFADYMYAQQQRIIQSQKITTDTEIEQKFPKKKTIFSKIFK